MDGAPKAALVELGTQLSDPLGQRPLDGERQVGAQEIEVRLVELGAQRAACKNTAVGDVDAVLNAIADWLLGALVSK